MIKVNFINHKLITTDGNTGFIVASGVNGMEVQSTFSVCAEDNYGTIDDTGTTPDLNLTFENCIAWTTGDGSFGVMYSGGNHTTQYVGYQNCTVIHGGPGGRMVIGFDNTDGPDIYSNFIFRDMTVESVSASGYSGQDHLSLGVGASGNQLNGNVAFVNIALPQITTFGTGQTTCTSTFIREQVR